MSSNLFSALGIDVQTLILQIAAFAILVFLVAKFVVPILLKSVDARQDAIEASAKQAAEAAKELAEASAKASDLLKEARGEAADILATAKEEATGAIEAATDRAKSQAEQILTNAHDQLQKDVASAKEMLAHETLTLVASATEKVARVKLDAKKDAGLIESILKGSN